MSKRTTIFVLFKEYPDPNGRGKSAPYIQDSADYLAFQNELMNDWTDVFDVLEYFAYEETNKYYDEKNIQGLLDVAQHFPNEYPMVVDTVMSGLQMTGLTPRSTSPIAKTEVYNMGVYDVTNDLLGDMAQREVNHRAVLEKVRKDVSHQMLPSEKEYEPCVLLQHGAVIAHGGIIRINMSGNRAIELKSVDSIIGLHQWLGVHRFPYRHYVFNDKHGDIGHKAKNHTDRHGRIIPSAQLLTSAGKTKALLKKAVGESFEGDLWYHDDDHGCFIYFENQGNTPQHEYHAYHLRPGDVNYDKIKIDKLRKVQTHI